MMRKPRTAAIVLSEWLEAERYRHKAEECMSIAEDIDKDKDEPRKILMQLARDYLNLAERIERERVQ